MHDWKKGDLGIANDIQAGAALEQPTFKPGTVVRFANYTVDLEGDPFVPDSLMAEWSLVFGPTPEKEAWFNHDTGLWLEYVGYIDPLSEK